MRTTVTEGKGFKTTRDDFYYLISPSRTKPGEFNVTLHYQTYGYYTAIKGIFSTEYERHYHNKDQVQKFYCDNKELSFKSITEAKNYIKHINQKSEKVYCD